MAVEHFKVMVVPNQVYRNIGAVVGNSLKIRQKLKKDNTAVHGTLACLQSFNMAELQRVLHLIDSLLQRLNMGGEQQVVRLDNNDRQIDNLRHCVRQRSKL